MTKINIPPGGSISTAHKGGPTGTFEYNINVPDRFVINCGSPSDYGYYGGGGAVDRTPVTIDRAPITEIYQTERWGMSGYEIDAPNGTYDIRCHFAECFFNEPNKRVFTVIINGIKQWTIDLFTEAGGLKAAITKTARNVKVTNEKIKIEFTGTPVINGIEVTKVGMLGEDIILPPPPPPPAPPPPPEPTVPVEAPPTVPAQPTSGRQAPAHALSKGYSKLAFVEEFDDPSHINLGTTLNPGQTFCKIGGQGNPVFGGCSVLPNSAVKFTDSSVRGIRVDPNDNNYQVDFTSAASLTNGFFLTGNQWCVEFRIRHSNRATGTGFPALGWSMDATHWFTNDYGRLFLEPDFYEYIGGAGQWSLHQWKSGDTSFHNWVGQSGGFSLPDVEQFFTASARCTPTEYAWYINGNKVAGRSPSWLSTMENYKGPIMFGSGPGSWYEVDWITVWTP